MSKTNGIKLTHDEYEVLNDLAERSGMDCWFSIADDGCGDDNETPLKKPLSYDRVWDLEEGKMMTLKDGVRQLDEGLTWEDLNRLPKVQKRVYDKLLVKLGLSDCLAPSVSSGIFRWKGNEDAQKMWIQMDSIVCSMRNALALKHWKKNSVPKNLTEAKYADIKKGDCASLFSREEFDRISFVFRDCLAMD